MSTEEVIIHCPICNETSPRGYLLCPFCGADLTVIYEQKIYSQVTYKEVWFRIKRLIVQPRVIAQEIADNPDGKGGFLFIVSIACSLAIQVIAYLIHSRTLNWKFYPVIFILVWIIALLLPLFVWLIGSWVIRTMTKLLGGKATRKQIRAAVGYSFLPVVASEALIAILFLIGLPWVNIPSANLDQIILTVLEMRNSFIGILGIILHFIGFLTSMVYLIFITKPASEFSWIETAIATGIPVLIFTTLMITYYVGTNVGLAPT